VRFVNDHGLRASFRGLINMAPSTPSRHQDCSAEHDRELSQSDLPFPNGNSPRTATLRSAGFSSWEAVADVKRLVEAI